MGDWFEMQAAGGSLVLALPVAAIAGLVSFFSPCVIPLLPGYLSYATGLSGTDLASGEAGRRRGRMMTGSALFVLGFTAVFVLVGATVGGVGGWLRVYSDEITVVMGALLIVLGLVFAGVLTRAFPGLQRDWRVHSVPAVGLGAAPLIGALFALGWSPCIGPTYSVIVGLTYTDATAGRGALLSAVYALGLGIPFIVAGAFYGRSMRAVGWVRRRQQVVARVGGAMLVVVGILLVTGWWDWMTQWLQLQVVGSFEVPI